MVAMAVVLNFFKFDLFAQGGSMNLLFIPLMVFALRRGPVWGMGAGLVFGVLKAIIGGGIAYGKETVNAISAMVDWIAPITVYPGEDELLALAQGALRVLRGEEKAQEYRRPRPTEA